MAQIVIFDMDGTLAKVTPARVRLLQDGKFEEFAKGIRQDAPIKPMVRLAQMFRQRGYDIHILTGRGESCRTATEEWLWQYNVPFQKMLMRPDDDVTAGHLLKWRWIRQSPYGKASVFAIFEDQTRAVQMYRSLGFFCLQPAQNTTNDQLVIGRKNHAALLDKLASI